MAAAIVNFTDEERGDTLDYVLTMSGVDLTLPGTQLWFTGTQVKGTPDAGAVWQKTIGAGIVVTSATEAIGTLDPVDTQALVDQDSVFYDWQHKSPTGRVTTPVKGTIVFSIDTTQSTA